PVPSMPAAMKQRYVMPLAPGAVSGGSGTAADPFRGLQLALRRAQPGDLLSLAPGLYVDGPFIVQSSGTRELPIAIQGPRERSAVLDGRGGALLIDVSGREHVWFERLTLRNATTLLQAD